MRRSDLLSIGEVAARTSLSVSAIRFYEERGLVAPTRNAGGQRVFMRSDIRRLSFVMIAQQLGFSIEQIGFQLKKLPDQRTPTKKDWTQIGHDFGKEIDAKIALLTLLRDKLDGCVGCGCLSLRKCSLYNPQDRAKGLGAGPRYLMGDSPEAVEK